MPVKMRMVAENLTLSFECGKAEGTGVIRAAEKESLRTTRNFRKRI